MEELNLLQIRQIIFDNFNEIDLRFNNDEILELMKKHQNFEQSQSIDDLESDFQKLEDDGLVRCIAQNFTTKWFKLFDIIENYYAILARLKFFWEKKSLVYVQILIVMLIFSVSIGCIF